MHTEERQLLHFVPCACVSSPPLQVGLGEYARLLPRNSCFGVLVFVFIAKCRCIGMSFLRPEVVSSPAFVNNRSPTS